MAAAVTGQNPGFEVRTIGRLFDAPFRTESYQGYGTGSVYDVAPDGQRFLINLVTRPEEPTQTPITVATNWTSLLRADADRTDHSLRALLALLATRAC